jgi:hypothetical protein
MLVLVVAAHRTHAGIERQVVELGWLSADGQHVQVSKLRAPSFDALARWVGDNVEGQIKSRAEKLRAGNAPWP